MHNNTVVKRMGEQIQAQDAIQRFVPLCEQEERDKALILRCLAQHDDILTRENPIAHLTASGFVVNRDRTATLMVYHNLYQSWAWTGGHADGDDNFLAVAMREAEEESGVTGIRPILTDMFTLDVLPVWSHVKRGQFVSSHLHLSVTYLLEADDTLPLVVCEEENSGVMWVPLSAIHTYSTEPDMYPVYDKIVARMQELGL